MKRLLLLLLLCFILIPAVSLAQDFEETKRLAEAGFPNSQFNLGLMYCIGQSVPQDYVQAVEWFRKAAEHGYGSA